MLIILLYNGLLLAACLSAARMGAWEERACAFVAFVATLLTVFTAGKLDMRFLSANLRLAMIDASALVSFAIVGMRSRKYWPIWVSAMQLVTFLANFAPLLEVHGHSLAYAIAEQMWAWLILTVILVSSLRQWRVVEPAGAAR